MIYIGEDWYLGGDPLNIMLIQQKTNQSKEKLGEIYYVTIGNYDTVQQLLDALVRKKIRLSVADAESLHQVIKDEQLTHDMIDNFCRRFETELNESMKEVKKRGRTDTTDTDISE